MNNINLLLVGVGGQGTILASKVLAEVAMQSGLDVKMSEIHGMAQRGGSVVTHVKIGSKVFSPLVEKGEADIIMAFEQLEALRWLDYLKPEGEVLVSRQIIEPVPVILGKAKYPDNIVAEVKKVVSRVIAVDAVDIAGDCGNPKASNVVMIGMLAQKLDFSREVWIEALRKLVPPALLQINEAAFEKGCAC